MTTLKPQIVNPLARPAQKPIEFLNKEKKMMNRAGATAPETITVEQILARMREGTKEVFELRQGAFTFHVRVLTLDETNQIRRFSIAEADRLGGDKVDRNVEMQKASLKMASTLQSGGVPQISDKLLSFMRVDEVNALFEEYVTIVDSVNPQLQTIKEDEFRALVDALKKNQISSKDLSLKQLRAICTSFVDVIQRQEQASSPPAS